jgi:phosphoribosylformylglycinamidine synthase
VCNGFQILCEAGLLPGALMRNQEFAFRLPAVNVRAKTSMPFTSELEHG